MTRDNAMASRSASVDPFLFLILAGAIVLPRVPIGGLGLRISDIIALGVVPLLILLRHRFARVPQFGYLISIWLAMLSSTLYGYAVLGVPLSLRDLNELVRMAIPFLVLWASVSLPLTSLRKTIIVLFRFGTPLLITFGVLQYLFPTLIPTAVLDLYGGRSHVEVLMTRRFPRVFVTGTDPNAGAAILLLFFLYHAGSLIVRKSYRSLIPAAAFLFLIAVTGSRTVFVALLCSILLFLVGSRRVRLSSKFAVFTLFVTFVVIVWIRVDYIRLGFQMLLAGENRSWLVRVDNFRESFALFRQSPLFGWGPAKAIHPTVVDGEYFLLLRRFGLLGFVLVIGFMKNASFLAYRSVRPTKFAADSRDVVLISTFLFYSVSMFVIMITNNFLSGYQLAIPYMVLLGFVVQVRQFTKNQDRSWLPRRSV